MHIKIQQALVIFVLLATLSGAFVSSRTTGLNGFVTLTERDPLFYSGVFQHDEFIRDLKILRDSERALEELAIANIEATNNRKDVYIPVLKKIELYPYGFLELLPEIDRATDAFLADPSGARATTLLDLYERAADEYAESIDSKIEALLTVTANYHETDKVYFFVDSASSVKVIFDDFYTIAENAAMLQREVALRRACFEGRMQCDRIAQEADTGDFFARVDEPFTEQDDAAMLAREAFPYPEFTERIGGPYRIDSNCWQAASSTHFMYLITHRETPGIFPIIPKLATQNYYSLVPRNPSPFDTISTAFRARGLDYYHQLEAMTYECTDLSFYPKLLALDEVKQRIDSGTTTIEVASVDPELRNLAANQFGVIGPALRTLATNLDFLTTSQRASTFFTISPQFLLTTRSAYSLVYMPYAHSVWRIDKKPQYFISDSPELRDILRTRTVTTDMLKERGYTLDQIRALDVNQRDVIEALPTTTKLNND